MPDRFNQNTDTKRSKIMIIILLFLIGLYMSIVVGLFNEPSQEPEGIIVRLILFIKQNMLIY